MAVDRIKLRENINRFFSLDEIESLCFDLGVDFENIGGTSKPGKVLELIQYMERRGRLEELAGACAKAREKDMPNANWGGIIPNQTSSNAKFERTNARDVGEKQIRIEDETTIVKELGPIKFRYALVVGVNKFVDSAFPPLRFCVSDAKAIAAELTKQNYLVKCLTDDLPLDSPLYPTRDNVEAELTTLAKATDPADMLLVHFSCHGTQVNNNPFLVLNNTRKANIANSGLAVSDIDLMMRNGKARRRIALLDACHVGIDGTRGDTDDKYVENVFELAWGSAMLAASTAEQVAFERDNESHGIFTHFLLNGLQGAAANSYKLVTVESLKNYVLNEVKQWCLRNNLALQQPTFKGDGMGDMILARLT